MDIKHLKNNKTRRFLSVSVIGLLLLFPLLFPITVSADGQGMVEPIYYTDGSLYPVVDYADLLNDDEEALLAQKIEDIQSRYQSAIVILTVDSTGSRTAEEYADDYYDYNGYGYGDYHDGVLLILAMEDRSWHISTTGSAIHVYTDSDIEYISDRFLSDLSDGHYFSGFNQFVSDCESELERAYNAGRFTPGKFAVCLLIGLILGGVVLFIFVAQLHTVRPASGAADYAQGGLKLSRNSDRFIRSTISKSKIPKDSGGSSTHTGSSGTSHGGGGGHF